MLRTARLVLAAALAAGAPAASPAAAQSLYNRGEHPVRALYSDPIANARGDIVTIVIREEQRIKNDEKTDLEKSSSLAAELSRFGIKPNAFNLPVDVAYSSTRQFEGSATYNKDGRFETRLSATVIDVMPNGNLVVEGRRLIRVDRETKSIRITGLVRPRDVDASNTVRSESVANARIEYVGDGPLTQTTNPGWFEALLGWLWPF